MKFKTRKQLKREIEEMNCKIEELEKALADERNGGDNFPEGCKSDMCRACSHAVCVPWLYGSNAAVGCDLAPKCQYFSRKSEE